MVLGVAGILASACGPTASHPAFGTAILQLYAAGLVSPQDGWVEAADGIHFTHNGGASWTNITPHDIVPNLIAGVDFLDSRHGWIASVIAHRPGSTEVYRTSDAGVTWSSTTITLPVGAAVGSAQFDFVDVAHGWLFLRIVTGASFQGGFVFTTADGGGTWAQMGINTAGFLAAADAKHAVSASGPRHDELQVTADGGVTWQPARVYGDQVSTGRVHPNGQRGQGVDIQFGQDRFFDRQYGLVLAVEGSPAAKLQLYGTHDAGMTWSAVGAVPDMQPSGGESVAFVDARTWIVTDGNRFASTRDDGKTWDSFVPTTNTAPIGGLSFASASIGWALRNTTHCAAPKTGCATVSSLLSTGDGGHTWSPRTITG